MIIIWLEENNQYIKDLERIILCLFLKKDIDIYVFMSQQLLKDMEN